MTHQSPKNSFSDHWLLRFVYWQFCSLALFFKTRTHLVFCDVGQGDGVLIRIGNKFDMVIDAGPTTQYYIALESICHFMTDQTLLKQIKNQTISVFCR